MSKNVVQIDKHTDRESRLNPGAISTWNYDCLHQHRGKSANPNGRESILFAVSWGV